MNQEVKAKWVKALRSGDYKQGRKRLHTIEGDDHLFCCLGVLCEVLSIPPLMDNETADIGYEGRLFGTLDNTIRDRVGLDFHEESVLINMNDDDRCSFKEIADYIEVHL